MLQATEAVQLSAQGTAAQAEARRKAEQTKKEAWIKSEADVLPGRIAGIEGFIRNATKRGDREVNTGLRFWRGRDYEENFSREKLCEPHRQLLEHFERAGYTVELRYEWEPLSMQHSSEWYDIVLKW